jgi:hypothetical protein
MPDTRFTLIGKACVMIVRASDSELRRMLKKVGFRGIKKPRSKKQLANDKKLGRMAKMRRR